LLHGSLDRIGPAAGSWLAAAALMSAGWS